MLCCCERDEQTATRIMSDYNIDLGEWGVSSVPALMAKIVSCDPAFLGVIPELCLKSQQRVTDWRSKNTTFETLDCSHSLHVPPTTTPLDLKLDGILSLCECS